jgi:hypothetical protein
MGLKENASIMLQRAYRDALSEKRVLCQHTRFIDYVIDNTHLTFKYILFTAILSKATDPKINALCLQKKSELPGAYDARTVCHKVIVPFEMEELEKVLGGSNEPFLNKPARFPELDKGNAVRRGNDQEILNALCDNLPTIASQQDAYSCLVYLLRKLIKLREDKRNLRTFSVPDSANLPSKLLLFIESALQQSFEGEVLTLLVAGVYRLLYQDYDAIVEVHPVNQSGASSNEISDLDVYIDGKLISSNELKDKIYTEHDVRHAADKVLQAGGTKMLFIEGPQGEPDGNFCKEIEEEYKSRNFMLSIVPCRLFFTSVLGVMHSVDCCEFMNFIINTAYETKFKEDTILYLDVLAQEILGLYRE